MAPHGKELSEDLKRRIVALHEDSQGYKKIANTPKLSCSTMAKIIRRFKRAGSTRNRHRVARPLLQRLNWLGVSLLGLRLYAALYMKLVCMAVTPGGSLFWRQYTRKPANSLLKTCQQRTWITGTMSYGLMRWRLICLVPMVSSMWPGEKYKDKCVMPTVKHGGGNVMVWGCMSAAGVGELYFIEGNMNSNMYCEILQQSMIPSIQKLGRRTVFQYDNDPKHTSKTTTALLKRLRWWTGQACLQTWTQ